MSKERTGENGDAHVNGPEQQADDGARREDAPPPTLRPGLTESGCARCCNRGIRERQLLDVARDAEQRIAQS